MKPILTGAKNFRSLGGLPSRDGRHLGGHALLRSDHLHDLTDADLATLATLGLRTVCDLRSIEERQRKPSRLPRTGLRDLHLAVLADVRSDPRYAGRLREDPTAQGAEAMMMAVYRQLPAAIAPHLGQLFDVLERGDAPLLLHCTAGKDRTGFATAVLLSALGITEEAILGDYLRTAESRLMTDPDHRACLAQHVSALLGMECSDAMMDAILGVRESYLAAALNEVSQRYGSMSDYLRTHSGMDTTRMNALRDRYLTP